MRLAGATYEEIARAGGGIVSTVTATRAAERGRAGRAAPAAARRAARRRRDHGRDQVRLRPRPRRPRRKSARARRAGSAPSAPRRRSRPRFLGAHALPPESDGDTRRATSTSSADEMLPAVAADGLADAVDASARASPSRPSRRRASSTAAQRARPAGQAARRPALEPAAAPRWPPRFGALSADHLEYTDEAGVARDGRGRHGRGAAARRLLLPARDAACRRSSLFRRHGVPMARRHRLQSRHLAADLAAAGHEHGRDAVPPDRRGVPRRRDPRGRARARAGSAEIGTLEAGKCCDLAIWDIERPAELVYRMGFNPLHARVWRGRVSAIVLTAPARSALADWRAIYRGAAPRARPGLPRRRSRRSAAAVARIVAKGEPVYGINTGFGKLASVRIDAADLAHAAAQHRALATRPASASRCRCRSCG